MFCVYEVRQHVRVAQSAESLGAQVDNWKGQRSKMVRSLAERALKVPLWLGGFSGSSMLFQMESSWYFRGRKFMSHPEMSVSFSFVMAASVHSWL